MADNAQVVPVEEPAATATATATTTEPEEAKSSDKMESQGDNKPRVGTLVALVNILAAGVLPIFTFVLSLTLLGYAVWLLYMRSYDCEDILGLPRVQTLASVGLLAVFVVSNAALFLRRKFPMPALVVMVVILLLMLFIGLAYAGVNEMQSRRFPATRMWFKLKIMDDVNWNNIKSCIYDKGACNDLIYESPNEKPYNRRNMPPIKNGCCMPPETCNMDAINATFWYRRKDEGPPSAMTLMYGDEMMVGRISDCQLWRNDWSILCYDCRSCKFGFVRSVRRKWWQLGIFLIVISILLLISHLLIFMATFWERFKG
ncbi:Tetraspanin/Peripherin [Arabidopsis thaliana x Arabidopsis arenosa]|uniref:Tetraspanin/Peripherin n=1 Tax=Arabidopsis thaliana x Arabidopsis arenosa TaxID=1240361 RepID=A0A8T1XKC1_9BRAS|nr:Tetraspanin/Peripherin [Arabidopsis thaliana x Arabidopsis arenosa]